MGGGVRLDMTNLLAPPNSFGKVDSDECVSHSLVPDDVASRLKQIIEETGLSARALSAKIGSSHGTIDAIIHGRSRNPEASRLQRIAEATGYNAAWLISGQGPPKGRSPIREQAERYDAMSAVRAMGRAAGYDPEFVDAFEVQLDADEQPDPDYLWTLMKAAWARHQRRTPPKGDPLSDLDEAPVRPARKKR
jgi:transcriptional regulator with XRE-family HTH domain